MTVCNIKRPSTAAKAFVEACEHLQYQRNPDFNGERIDGVGFAPLNVHNGWRRSTAVGYLKPNLARKNLELMTNTRVRRILFEASRAIGVEIERDGRIQRIGARRELDHIGRRDQFAGAAARLRHWSRRQNWQSLVST